MKALKLAVAESSAILRCGIIALLHRMPAANVDILEIGDISQLVAQLSRHRPDVLIVNPASLGLCTPPQLRAQTVQELLAQPGGAGCELCGTLQTLTGALTQCVRRRPGWLYAMFPSGITCPVPARPALVQAAVLEALRPVLACGGQAVLEVKPRSRAVLLCLRGGAPAGVLPLWQALARQSGGAVVFDSGAQFAAAAFLPLCPGCRIQKSPSTQELLEDRFSLPYLFLSGYCAGPW